MYTALYRAYRPEIFDEILGQEHIVKILKNQIATNTTSHAYLFCGTRGTGKTTTARLLAKGLNCTGEGERPCGQCSNCRAISEGNFIDVIEIDAASNNGVDNIRELRESVSYPPAVGRKKVYIIDEVHMLSAGAFNALLKTLEEPPEYVTFVLATTEVQKLPATILSRCMRLDFKRIPEKTLIDGLSGICSKIGINVSRDALRIIAANADGSVRDALSILDQCISGGNKNVSEADVLEFLGASGDEAFIELTERVRCGKTSEAIEYLADILSDGKDVKQFIRDWINHYRNLLLSKFVKDPTSILNMSSENIERLRRQSSVLELADINSGILELSKASDEARWSTQPRILLELSIVKMCMGSRSKASAGREPAAASAAPDAKATAKQEQKPEITQEPEPEPVNETASAIEREPQPEQVPESEQTIESETVAEPESAAEVQPEPVAADELQDAGKSELDRIWDAVYLDGESINGSFRMVSTNSRLIALDEHEFTVLVYNGFTKDLIEKNRSFIEDLMEKQTGKLRRMIINEETNAVEKMTAEEIADRAGKYIDGKVEVE